ncbi:MAG TPA: pectin acetylesterase-family hydrolase [Polyangiaceae bacterium]
MNLRLNTRVLEVSAALGLLLSLAACGGDDDQAGTELKTAGPCIADASAPVPARSEPGTWQRVDIPGAVCSNGSQYSIFVNYSATSNNLVFMLEPGGACWDYGSCSPDGGLRGAANPRGLPPGIDHMARFQFLPLARKEAELNPAHDWNKIFIPYCTGDIHTGNNVITYSGPNGEVEVFRHNGHDNIMRVIGWANTTFPVVPRMLVTGCSAGGAGAIINYHYFRKGMSGAQCGYLLNDSGPIFPSDGNSGPLHAKVRQSWNLDPLIDALDGELAGVTVAQLKQDFGLINVALANKYPQDRLALTVYRRDLNYSLYSYESFFMYPPYTRIHDLWEQDIARLRQVYDSRDNLAYFMPFFRIDNCSHCVSIPPIGLDGKDLTYALTEPWRGSEIQESSLNLKDYTAHLLDDTQPLQSYFEGEQTGEGFTTEEAAACEGL